MTPPLPYPDTPWRHVSAADLAGAAAVTSMLGEEETQFYHWVGRQSRGLGATIDLGAFAGGSAARLLSGLARSGQPYHLHAYDFFTATGRARERWVPDAVPDAKGTADILPQVTRRLAPWAGHFTLHRGDILQARWPAEPIEILAVDAAKSTALTDHTAAEFYPSLIAGQSWVIHQDFLHEILPWIPAQMVALRDCFDPVAKVENDCVIFRCRVAPGAEQLRAAQTAGLTDSALTERVWQAAEWLAPFAGRGRFQKMADKISANPGVRIGWKMK
jgi:hypothetical protein